MRREKDMNYTRLAGLFSAILIMGAFGGRALAFDIFPTDDPAVLRDALVVGDGITITDTTYLGGPSSAGTYIDGPLDLPDGIIITSGLAEIALPPNDATGADSITGCRGIHCATA